MFGKLDYWRIYFSLTVKVALSLQNSCEGRQEEGGRRKAVFAGGLLLQLGSFSSSAGPAGLGQSSSCRVFSYVPRKMKPPRLMAAIRGTTPANKLKGEGKAVSEGERRADAARLAAGASENKARKNPLLLVSLIPPHCSLKEPVWASLTEHSQAGWFLTPLHTPQVQKQRCRRLRAVLWSSDTSPQRAAGRWDVSHPLLPPSSLGRGTPSPCREPPTTDSPAHCSGSFPTISNRDQQQGSGNGCAFSCHDF